MKAEERHELKENDLASWLQYGLPMFLKQNGSYILLVIALGFLGYQLYAMYERKQDAARLSAWDELRTVEQVGVENPAAKLQSIADLTDIKELKAQAYLKLAELYQRSVLYPEKSAAVKGTRGELLDRAYDAYSKAKVAYGDDELGVGMALLGEAAVEEDRGHWDQAKTIYEAMVKQSKDSPFGLLAGKRLATLDDRRVAPRLAAMMAPSPATGPTGTMIPGLLPGYGPVLPEATTPSPLGPATMPGIDVGPVIPGGAAVNIAPPATAPAK